MEEIIKILQKEYHFKFESCPEYETKDDFIIRRIEGVGFLKAILVLQKYEFESILRVQQDTAKNQNEGL